MQKHPLIQKIFAMIVVLGLLGTLVYMFSSRQTATNENPYTQRDEQSAHMLQTDALQLSIDDPEIAPQDAPTDPPESIDPATPTPPVSQPPSDMPELITPDPNRTPVPSEPSASAVRRR